MHDDPIQRDPLDRSLYGTPYATTQILEHPEADIIVARRIGSGEEVLVKVVHLDEESDDTTVEERRLRGDRLRLEHDILTRLAGPLFPEIIDAGTTPDGRPYFVLPPIRNQTLATILAARRSLTVAEALTVVRALLPCLAAAHAAGIVHRDVRLGNVWLRDTPSGAPGVWLLGFNLAKLTNAAKSQLRPIARPTEESSLLGGARWAAPEVILGGEADERSDVYQVGLILFALISGANPFDTGQADRISGTLQAPPLSSVAPCPISPALDAVVATALAVSPARRYPSVDALAQAMDALTAPGALATTELLPGPLASVTTPATGTLPLPVSRAESLPVAPPEAPAPHSAYAASAPTATPSPSAASSGSAPLVAQLAAVPEGPKSSGAMRNVVVALVIGAAIALIIERVLVGAP